VAVAVGVSVGVSVAVGVKVLVGVGVKVWARTLLQAEGICPHTTSRQRSRLSEIMLRNPTLRIRPPSPVGHRLCSEQRDIDS
jgi:hypothetical protein